MERSFGKAIRNLRHIGKSVIILLIFKHNIRFQ